MGKRTGNQFRTLSKTQRNLSRIFTNSILAIGVCFVLSSCGFQLRSSATQANIVNSSIYISIADSLDLEKNFVFARQLESTIYQLYLRPQIQSTQASPTGDSYYQLIVDDITMQSYDSAVNYNRATTRQELNFTISYRVKNGDTLIGKRQVNIKRFLNSSPGNPNSSSAERILVNNEIFEAATQRMTQQINYLLSQSENLHSSSDSQNN